MYNINPLLIFLVSFGMVAVCLCFVVLMPAMGNLMAALWTNSMAEQGMAKMAGREPHTTLRDPNKA